MKSMRIENSIESKTAFKMSFQQNEMEIGPNKSARDQM